MTDTVLGLIYFIAFSHALMLGVSLWRKSAPNSAGRILSVISLVVSYKLFEGGALYAKLYPYLGHLMDLLPGEVLLIGPLIFAYISKVSGQADWSKRIWVAHLIPICAIWLYNSPSVFRSIENKTAMWDHVLISEGGGQLPIVFILLFLGIKTHLSIYLLLSWDEVKRFGQSAQLLRSDNSPEVLNRVRFLIVAFFFLELTWVGLFLAQQYLGLGTLAMVSDVWLLFVATAVLAIGYVGLQSPNLVFSQEEQRLVTQNEQPQEAAPESLDPSSNIKYLHSALEESTGEVLAKSLENQIEQEQLYLQEKLTLTDLAKVTDIKSHTLSQVINQVMKTNFYQLINNYRVQHAVNLIEQPNLNWPLERIALESGFGNRVTFSKAFKKIMDCTPSEYKSRLKQQQDRA